MFNKGQLAGLMKQAQNMQDNMKKAQDELAFIEVTAEAGGGLVKVTMTCKHDVKRVEIDPSLLADDKKNARLNCIHHLLEQMPYGATEHPAIVLPERVRHDNYVRNPVPQDIVVPEIY